MRMASVLIVVGLLALPALAVASEHRVVPEVANMRDGRGTHYEVVDQLRKGHRLEVWDRGGRWAMVTSLETDLEGYIRSDLIEPTPESESASPVGGFFGLGVTEIGVLVGLGLGLLFSCTIYLLPILIAMSRSHPNIGPILVVNLLLGWSVFGWVAALVMAVTQQPQRPAAGAQLSGRPADIPPKRNSLITVLVISSGFGLFVFYVMFVLLPPTFL